jgi:hypothetical protein
MKVKGTWLVQVCLVTLETHVPEAESLGPGPELMDLHQRPFWGQLGIG